MSERPHKRSDASWISTALLAVAAVVLVYPFAWMLLSAFKSNVEIFQPRQFWPSSWDPVHFRDLFQSKWFPFWRVLGNSLFIAAVQSVAAVVVTSMAGYIFARRKFRGRSFLFLIALLTIVIPPQGLVVPMFNWMRALSLVDRLWGAILPGIVSGIGILYFTQVFRQVPSAYIDAARIDGAGEWRVYRTLLPMLNASLISYGLIHFIMAWHQHLLPLMILGSDNQTLPLALTSLYGSSLRFNYAVLMAGSAFAILPVAILFAILHRRFKSALGDLLVH